MGSYPPQNQKQWCKILKKLGFIENNRVGIGGHAKKFYHPERHSSDFRVQPDFIIVQNKMYKQMSQKIIKELSYFDFTPKEIKESS
jgi:hypothetical protein